MGYTIDGSAFVAAVRRLAEDQPSRIYRTCDRDGACRYTRSADTPGMGCLIGEALMACGIPRDVLAAVDDKMSTGLLGLISHLGIAGLNEYQMWWGNKVQSHQDRNQPWSICVVMADKQYPSS